MYTNFQDFNQIHLHTIFWKVLSHTMLQKCPIFIYTYGYHETSIFLESWIMILPSSNDYGFWKSSSNLNLKNDRCLEFEDSRGPAKQLSCTSTDLVLQPNQFYEWRYLLSDNFSFLQTRNFHKLSRKLNDFLSNWQKSQKVQKIVNFKKAAKVTYLPSN